MVIQKRISELKNLTLNYLVMYKAIFKIQIDCIDTNNRRIFTPFINCYELHSSIVHVNGVSYEEQIEYNFLNEYTNWTGDFELETDDIIIFELEYFYIRKHDNEILGFLVNQHNYSNSNLTKQIVSKHYVEGQFSLDNGLYKNAVLNFGTTLEGMLNKQMNNHKFVDLITSYTGQADANDMTYIRVLRNKVHPNQINQFQDITRIDAVKARNALERIIKKF